MDDNRVEEMAAAIFDAYNTSGPPDTHYKAWNGTPVPRWEEIDESTNSVKDKWRQVARIALSYNSEELRLAREALGLAQSMIRSGESETDISRETFRKGFGKKSG